jgi:hypothetical protein
MVNAQNVKPGIKREIWHLADDLKDTVRAAARFCLWSIRQGISELIQIGKLLSKRCTDDKNIC